MTLICFCNNYIETDKLCGITEPDVHVYSEETKDYSYFFDVLLEGNSIRIYSERKSVIPNPWVDATQKRNALLKLLENNDE